MVLLEGVDLPFAISAPLVKLAIFAGGKVITQTIKAFRDTDMAGPFLAGFAELLMVLVIVALAALGASKDI